MQATTQLPFVDEHETTVAAGADDVWTVLTQTVERAPTRAGWAAYARIVGCSERSESGPRPIVEGSTVPGFRVAVARPGSVLALEGRHRFSSYALIFRIEPVGPGSSRLRAETRAAFPGPAGAAYRALVVGTGGHAVAVRRLLSTVKRRSEVRSGSRL